MDPQMCQSVWLIIVAVYVCSLGEEYVWECAGVCVCPGEAGKMDVFSAAFIILYHGF